jgi:hypothetical protein
VVASKPFIQLLPDLEEARIIRTALYEYMEKRNSNPDPTAEDACWKWISKISVELRKEYG